MTCAEAKLVPILLVCSRLGARRACVSVGKGYALFHAPYREDVHPSLRLDLRANRWVDMATGQYGDVVDLVRATLSLSTADALSFLDGGVNYIKTSAIVNKKPSVTSDMVIKPLRHPLLLNYAVTRGIAPRVIQRFCYEAHAVAASGKPYVAIAFPSNNGGYELRNKGFKGCCGRKGITVLGSGPILSFFEGFFDFLSHVQDYGYQDAMTYIILNSVTMLDAAIMYAKSRHSTSHVELWLDNDPAGREAVSAIIDYFPTALDMSYIYADFKDLNAKIEQSQKGAL